jgi:hypothetical protein
LRLPNADQVRVESEKITSYLLSASHADGRSKADFFGRFGFRMEEWQVLMEALRKHGASHQVVRVMESSFGTRYSVDGALKTPDGRNPSVRTVWMVETGSTTPRLITAYPIRR